MKTGFAHYERPLLLLVPGLENSGPRHWQSIWERERGDCARVNLGGWNKPQRNAWVTRLNVAVAAARRPVILVGHSLGCHAIAWWSAMERPCDGKVAGAMLVAPPEIEDAPIDARLSAFAPLAHEKLAFPSLMIASRNDPYASFGRAKRMARIWGSRLIDAGPMGHINAESEIGDWPYGQFLLGKLIDATVPRHTPLAPGRAGEMLATPVARGLEFRL